MEDVCFSSSGYILIVSWESIHEGHAFKTTRIVDHDIHNGEEKLILRTSFNEILEVDIDSNLPIPLSNKDNVGHPIQLLLFPNEAKVDKNLDFILNRSYYFWVKPSLLLFDRFRFRIDVELIHDHLRVETWYVFVSPCEDVYVLSNKFY